MVGAWPLPDALFHDDVHLFSSFSIIFPSSFRGHWSSKPRYSLLSPETEDQDVLVYALLRELGRPLLVGAHQQPLEVKESLKS